MTPEEKKELRHIYAGMAMQGIVNNQLFIEASMGTAKKLDIPMRIVIAQNATAYADALIKELEETED